MKKFILLTSFALVSLSTFAMKLAPENTTLITPDNDGEAHMIIALANKLKGIDLRISKQQWGAELEKEPISILKDLRPNIIIVEMPSPALEKELAKNHVIYILDHHHYKDIDRSHKTSSLEQFAQLFDIVLNRFERGIAINDRDYIYGLIAEKYAPKEIRQIRKYDLTAQGYTKELLALNKKAFKEKQRVSCKVLDPESLFVAFCTTTKVSYLADLVALLNTDKVNNLLVFSYTTSGINEINFYGNPDTANMLYKTFTGWFGGGEKSKYWGTGAKISIVKLLQILQIKSTTLHQRIKLLSCWE